VRSAFSFVFRIFVSCIHFYAQGRMKSMLRTMGVEASLLFEKGLKFDLQPHFPSTNIFEIPDRVEAFGKIGPHSEKTRGDRPCQSTHSL
jgi:hypothetical protein